MKELYLLLRVLFSPSLWYSKPQYNKSWDRIVRELMLENVPVFSNKSQNNGLLGSYMATSYQLGTVYINLHPGEYFGASHDGNVFILSGAGLSRRTRLLLRDYVNDSSYREYKKLHSKLHKALK